MGGSAFFLCWLPRPGRGSTFVRGVEATPLVVDGVMYVSAEHRERNRRTHRQAALGLRSKGGPSHGLQRLPRCGQSRCRLRTTAMAMVALMTSGQLPSIPPRASGCGTPTRSLTTPDDTRSRVRCVSSRVADKAAKTWDPAGKYWEAGGGGIAWDNVAFDRPLDRSITLTCRWRSARRRRVRR